MAAIDKLSVVIAIAMAVAFLGEPLNWRVVLGGTLIALGTLTIAK